jgi:hypothetical protein
MEIKQNYLLFLFPLINNFECKNGFSDRTQEREIPLYSFHRLQPLGMFLSFL